MEEKIQRADFDTLGSRIVVRTGDPHRHADLEHVAAAAAKSIVIMPDRTQRKELRDAFVLMTLIALRGSGWPLQGRILAVNSLPRNRMLMEEIGGSVTDVVMVDAFVAKLMV